MQGWLFLDPWWNATRVRCLIDLITLFVDAFSCTADGGFAEGGSTGIHHCA